MGLDYSRFRVAESEADGGAILGFGQLEQKSPPSRGTSSADVPADYELRSLFVKPERR